MPCTVKKSFEAARDAGAILIALVKGNQPGLLNAIPKGTLEPEWQGLLTSIVRVSRERLDRSSRSGLWTPRNDEVAFHVSSAPLSAAVAATAIRGHWGIENRSHHVRDVTMAEDASRIRKNPGILARIRSFATNILRANGAENIRDARYRIAIGGIDAILRCRGR